MKVGDLVRHIIIKRSRQVGVITEARYSGGTFIMKYKVLWANPHIEEYWFSNKEVEALCK